MKVLPVPLLLLLMTALSAFANASEEYRTFTDEQGRTIRAAVVRTGPGEVWIRRDDGKTFQVARTTFIESDRRFIEQWERTTALSAPNALEFTVRRYSDGRRTVLSEAIRTTTVQSGYVVTIANNTTMDLNNLLVEYRYYVLRGELDRTGQNRRMEPNRGSVRIATLPSRGTEEFKTGTVRLVSTNLRPDWTYANTNRRRTDDSLGGVWVRVRQNGELVAEFSSPSRLKETETW